MEKEKVKKEGKLKHTQQGSTHCKCIQNLKTLALIGSKKSVTITFIGKIDKWTHKTNDKH